ncbi:MAG: CPBP family intramembrane glutamic endopeptidase [Phycisphaeraceae bacterium]
MRMRAGRYHIVVPPDPMRLAPVSAAGRRRAILALLLLVPAASVGTFIAMVAAPGPIGQAVFLVAKAWLLLFPVVWLMAMDRVRPTLPRPSRRGMTAALATGVAIFLAIFAGYGLVGAAWIDPELMRRKAMAVGLTTPAIYLAGAVYWCTVNSILEEYVWRWFVFIRLELLLPRAAAVLASGLLFTLHHIIALSVYFDWRITLLASLGVLVGGTTWSWLYLRYRNLYAAYVSHVFADIAIFILGYWLIFR